LVVSGAGTSELQAERKSVEAKATNGKNLACCAVLCCAVLCEEFHAALLPVAIVLSRRGAGNLDADLKSVKQ